MTIHIVGAGLAGLAAACLLTESGRRVILLDSAPAAGGRARSYFDKMLGCRVDNGNHLMLSGNFATLNYLNRVGARRALAGPASAIFPFFDLTTHGHWTLRLNDGPFPWWIFSRRRRVPGTNPLHYLALRKLRDAPPHALITAAMPAKSPLTRNFLEPLAISALNTMPVEAACGPLQAVLAETIARGGFATIPRYARIGLSEAFVDPALDWLRDHGVEMRFGRRVTALDPNTPTILAVPPWIAAELVPGLVVPDQFESICNLHFKASIPPGEAGFWGFTGGMTEWAFARPDIISVTISAANRHAALDNAVIAAQVWGELVRAFNLPAAIPAHRVVWERRATILGSPEQQARRPKTVTANPNLVLAGDWTDTGLPATIEGAIRSGNGAATALMQFPE